ncbi:MAG: phosphoribosylglycinamide synthetase [Cyanobacteria bacterium RYN_339]|nr:phosphoribosylglycinamide synthetase [Cyanobacteria bacterium RYN_339]
MKHCVIVDGYSAGNLLPAEFKARGYAAIHVQSTPVIWPILTLTYRPDDYAHHFAYEGDLAPLVQGIQGLEPVAVLAGTETGVELADQLSEALGLPTNGTRLSAARRDKHVMIETARAAGLKVARQFKGASAAAIVDWVAREGLAKVVVKPLKSAGTDSVAVCRTAAEIEAACERIVGKVNQLGLMNDEVLCQEFLEGTEYALDAVSLNGQAHFTAIWKYHKVTVNDAEFVYDRDELVSCRDEVGQALCAYTREVLAALEITQGPSHAEIMLTPDGPALVEIGTRLNGITTPALHERCVGYGQLDLTVDACVDATAFAAKAAEPYDLKEYALSISLISEQTGTVSGVPGEALIRALPSFNEVRMRAKPGYELRRTIDFYTHPGFAILVHPDREVLHTDLGKIRGHERAGRMYDL